MSAAIHRRRQRRLVRELTTEYLDDHPDATAEEAHGAVQKQIAEEYGLEIDPATIFMWIKALLAIWKMFK